MLPPILRHALIKRSDTNLSAGVNEVSTRHTTNYRIRVPQTLNVFDKDDIATRGGLGIQATNSKRDNAKLLVPTTSNLYREAASYRQYNHTHPELPRNRYNN